MAESKGSASVGSVTRSRAISSAGPGFEGVKNTIMDTLQEERLRQAFYYSAANGLLVVIAAAGIALWFVFQEFIEPLFWAVLCGALLHPLKTKWVSVTDNWLRKLSERHIPLVLGIIILILSIPGMIFRFFTRVCYLFFGLEDIFLFILGNRRGLELHL